MKSEAKARVPRCHRCGKHFEHVIATTHVQKMKYDGGRYEVLVEGMPQWQCADCQITVTDDDSDTVVHDSLRRHIGLLSAEEIRGARTALGLTQTDLAGLLGCADDPSKSVVEAMKALPGRRGRRDGQKRFSTAKDGRAGGGCGCRREAAADRAGVAVAGRFPSTACFRAGGIPRRVCHFSNERRTVR
jgi:hypothetical protein